MTSLPSLPTPKKLGLVIDLDVCVGCHACVISCKEWNTGGYGAALSDQEGWQTILAEDTESSPTEIPAESDQPWPLPRSVASLEALTIGGGREYLVLTMGERTPSPDGHEAAGKFLDDVWMFQVPPLGMTVASVTAAMMQAVGRKTGEGKWTKVDLAPYDDDNSDDTPAPRGWLASAVMGDLEENAILIWGGLAENNHRLEDGWILRLGS